MALAQKPDWTPTRPVRLLVTQAAGGPTDVVARAFAEHARELTITYALFGCVGLGACALAWWPLDRLVTPDPHTEAAFAFLRLCVLAVVGVAGAAFASPGARTTVEPNTAATAAVAASVPHDTLYALLDRHESGDWGGEGEGPITTILFPLVD